MEIEDLFKKWEKYLTGKADYHHGQVLANHSIMVNIQRMVDDSFIFETFNNAGLEMSKNKKNYKKNFCSNKYLISALTKWYLETQSLYVRRLTENSGKRWEDTCSLMNLLTAIEKNACHLNRESFCNFHKKDQDDADTKFDILSDKKNSSKKDSDQISKKYIMELKKRLETPEISDVKNYTDKVVAHCDFKTSNVNFSIDKIKKCHESIIKVYQEINSNFFLRVCDFGKTSLKKEMVLQNADKPFLI